MLRYLLFAGEQYYPGGGWEDYKGTFATLEEAQEAESKESAACGYGWSHIVDTNTMEMLP